MTVDVAHACQPAPGLVCVHAELERARWAEADEQQAAWSRPLRCVDHVYRGKDYRLAEPDRSAGASVRIVDGPAQCLSCNRLLTPAAKGIRLPDRARWLHVLCAIGTGALVVMEPRL